ncbi:MAG: hypothetical protein KatS3mg032_2367 [Cyclobacteriaceae bacterium]|nr:MAG: hypothetical protein KatS3mg032_2367 [Cyclobacteriaceae bacterium]
MKTNIFGSFFGILLLCSLSSFTLLEFSSKSDLSCVFQDEDDLMCKVYDHDEYGNKYVAAKCSFCNCAALVKAYWDSKKN